MRPPKNNVFRSRNALRRSLERIALRLRPGPCLSWATHTRGWRQPDRCPPNRLAMPTQRVFAVGDNVAWTTVQADITKKRDKAPRGHLARPQLWQSSAAKRGNRMSRLPESSSLSSSGHPIVPGTSKHVTPIGTPLCSNRLLPGNLPETIPPPKNLAANTKAKKPEQLKETSVPLTPPLWQVGRLPACVQEASAQPRSAADMRTHSGETGTPLQLPDTCPFSFLSAHF